EQADAAANAVIGRAQRPETRAVQPAAPFDADVRFVTVKRRDMRLRERVSLATVEQQALNGLADEPVGIDVDAPEVSALNEGEDELVVGRPDRPGRVEEKLERAALVRFPCASVGRLR